MTRFDIKLCKNGDAIDIWIGDKWFPTALKPDMDIANRTIPDVKSLLDSYLDTGFLTAREWDLRLSEQLKIGAALRKSIFGDREIAVGTHLRIVPVLDPKATQADNDDFVSFLTRIPWTMLTRSNDPGKGFLALGLARPVAITVDANPQNSTSQKIRLPRAPRILLVMPEVKQKRVRDQTGAAEHRKSLLEILQPHYDASGVPENIRCVRTFGEYERVMKTEKFYPEIIYFYGHGFSPGQGTTFEFETGPGEKSADRWRTVSDLVAGGIGTTLEATRTPPLIWFNACLGAAASQESALVEFSSYASCVIAMRTVVRIDASQTLAQKALKSIILDGFAPPIAIREALINCPADWIKSGHWASIAISEQYAEWTAIGETKDTAGANDAVGDFPSRVDRREALDDITETLSADFANDSGSSEPTVLLWAGSIDEMPVQFAERTRDVISDNFLGFRPIYIDVDLQQGVRPGQVDQLKPQLRAAIMIALDNGQVIESATTAEIIGAIGRISPGQRCVLTFFHGPLTAKHAGLVQTYIGLWASICRELSIIKSPTRIALAFGFVTEVGEPIVFPADRKPIRLGAVPPAELRAHLSRYRLLYDVDITELDDRTECILKNTEGVFSRLVDSLRQLAGFKTV
ncbi:hypothetical protein [Rhizobium sp. 768_B6_N1_8]|uniref:hypothetical protein n=1 Tax=unclassified Rhizobium TaxID=2613769 RepID=UPI003F26ABAB